MRKVLLAAALSALSLAVVHASAQTSAFVDPAADHRDRLLREVP